MFNLHGEGWDGHVRPMPEAEAQAIAGLKHQFRPGGTGYVLMDGGHAVAEYASEAQARAEANRAEEYGIAYAVLSPEKWAEWCALVAVANPPDDGQRDGRVAAWDASEVASTRAAAEAARAAEAAWAVGAVDVETAEARVAVAVDAALVAETAAWRAWAAAQAEKETR